MENKLPLSAQTESYINTVISFQINQGRKIDTVADQITKEQLVSFVNSNLRTATKTKIAERKLSKNLVLFLYHLSLCKNATEHYQVLRDQIKIQYESIVNDYSTLKYFGLIVKAKKSGEWTVTKKGFAFLRAEIGVNLSLSIQNDRVIRYSNEIVNIHDFNDLPITAY